MFGPHPRFTPTAPFLNLAKYASIIYFRVVFAGIAVHSSHFSERRLKDLPEH
jgi:hypothetical protein